jgi:hypothetical protein
MPKRRQSKVIDTTIGRAIGSSLVATGLYIGTFEMICSLMHIAVESYIGQRSDDGRQDALNKLEKARKNAKSLIDFCDPYLLENKILEKADIQFLHAAREYRNHLTHETFARPVTGPKIFGISEDITRLVEMGFSLERWDRTRWPPNPPGFTRIAFMYSGGIESWHSVALALAKEIFLEESSVRP